jgi:hypothetical protein
MRVAFIAILPMGWWTLLHWGIAGYEAAVSPSTRLRRNTNFGYQDAPNAGHAWACKIA